MYLLLLAGWTALAISIVAWLLLLPVLHDASGSAAVRYARWLSRLRLLVVVLPTFLAALHFVVARAANGAAPSVSRALAAGTQASAFGPIARVTLVTIGWMWLAGCVYLLAQLFRALLRERSLLRRSQIANHNTRERLRAATAQLGISRHIDLRVAAVDTPMVVGRTAATILVPAFAWSSDDAQTDALLLHELAHVRRGDSQSNLWIVAASLLYWWHPAVRRAINHARCEREFACDDLAASALGSRTALAQALVGLADTRHRAQSGMLRIAADAHPLLERVRRLVAPPVRAVHVGPLVSRPHAIPSISLALGALVCAAAMLTARADATLGKAYARSWVAPSTLVTFSGKDSAGLFSLAMRNGRVESVTIDRVVIPESQIAVRGDSVAVHNASGARVMSLAIDPRGAIAWDARAASASTR